MPEKPEEGKSVEDQEQEICQKCAAFIATKRLELLKLGKPTLGVAALREFTKSPPSAGGLETFGWPNNPR